MDLLSVNADSCVLCGLCSVACPFDALSLTIDDTPIKERDNYPTWEVESEVNEKDCLYCGRCTIACPRDAILFERKLPEREELVRGEINIDDEKCIFCGFCFANMNFIVIELYIQWILLNTWNQFNRFFFFVWID